MDERGSVPTRKIHKILVGFDGSADADEATRLAMDLGCMLGAEVTILGILRNVKSQETDEDNDSVENDAKNTFQRMMTPFTERAEAISVSLFTKTITSDSDPAELIANHAQEYGFDLVVVGSRGEEQIFHTGLGKGLGKLLRHARCPVLVTPAHSHNT